MSQNDAGHSPSHGADDQPGDPPVSPGLHKSWTKVADLAERRRIQHRGLQHDKRKKLHSSSSAAPETPAVTPDSGHAAVSTADRTQQVADDSDVAPSTVYSVSLQCRSSLKECTARDALCVDDWAARRLADFNLWAASSGALAKEGASLDTRLAHNVQTHDRLLSSLRLLLLSTQRCLAQSDSGIPTILNDAQTTVEGIAERIFRLTAAIRRSGNQARLDRADRYFDPKRHAALYSELVFIVNVAHATKAQKEQGLISLDSLQQPLTDIQQRLVDANLRRRNRFIYAQKHSSKLAIERGDDFNSTSASESKSRAQARPLHMAPGAVPSALGSTPHTATTTPTEPYDGSNLVDASNVSKTIVSVTTARTEFPKAPPLQEGATLFKCPCCCQTLSEAYHTGPRWKKHLSRDILPYTCVLDGCNQRCAMFATSDAWKEHMRTEHKSRQHWACIACDETLQFQSDAAFIAHAHAKHSDEVPEEELETFVALCSRSGQTELDSCPLCPYKHDESEHSLTLFDHVVEHLHSFAMRSLPSKDPPESESVLIQRPEGGIGYFECPENPYFADNASEASSVALQVSPTTSVTSASTSPPGESAIPKEFETYVGALFKNNQSGFDTVRRLLTTAEKDSKVKGMQVALNDLMASVKRKGIPGMEHIPALALMQQICLYKKAHSIVYRAAEAGDSRDKEQWSGGPGLTVQAMSSITDKYDPVKQFMESNGPVKVLNPLRAGSGSTAPQHSGHHHSTGARHTVQQVIDSHPINQQRKRGLPAETLPQEDDSDEYEDSELPPSNTKYMIKQLEYDSMSHQQLAGEVKRSDFGLLFGSNNNESIFGASEDTKTEQGSPALLPDSDNSQRSRTDDRATISRDVLSGLDQTGGKEADSIRLIDSKGAEHKIPWSSVSDATLAFAILKNYATLNVGDVRSGSLHGEELMLMDELGVPLRPSDWNERVGPGSTIICLWRDRTPPLNDSNRAAPGAANFGRSDPDAVTSDSEAEEQQPERQSEDISLMSSPGLSNPSHLRIAFETTDDQSTKQNSPPQTQATLREDPYSPDGADTGRLADTNEEQATISLLDTPFDPIRDRTTPARLESPSVLGKLSREGSPVNKAAIAGLANEPEDFSNKLPSDIENVKAWLARNSPSTSATQGQTTSEPILDVLFREKEADLRRRFPEEDFTLVNDFGGKGLSFTESEWGLRCNDCPYELFTPEDNPDFLQFERHLNSSRHILNRYSKRQTRLAQDESPRTASSENSPLNPTSPFPSNRDSHTSTRRRMPFPDGYRCVECGSLFNRIRDLNLHKRTHNPRQPCNICGRLFVSKREVMRHVDSVHTQARPFQCDQCQSAFAREDNLDRHVATVHRGRTNKGNEVAASDLDQSPLNPVQETSRIQDTVSQGLLYDKLHAGTSTHAPTSYETRASVSPVAQRSANNRPAFEKTPPDPNQSADSAHSMKLAPAAYLPLPPEPRSRTKPPEKVVLAPGHTPLDWADLTRTTSRAQMSGVETLRQVTHTQLRAMDGTDGTVWTAFDGRVYNITPFLPFHPGGESELMWAAGRAADGLIQEIHPWVNVQNMLQACLVGVLVNESEIGGPSHVEMD